MLWVRLPQFLIPAKVAGFEPAIAGLEAAALDQAKLHPKGCRAGTGGVPRPTDSILPSALTACQLPFLNQDRHFDHQGGGGSSSSQRVPLRRSAILLYSWRRLAPLDFR
jgi:hypothetical protein